MANFSVVTLDINSQGTATPSWRAIGGASTEIRFSDDGVGETAVASADWKAMIRPGTSQGVPYLYAFTADTTGYGVYGGTAGQADPATYSKDDYKQARWNWDNLGTFAAAPVMTAYDDSNHNSPGSRGTGGLLAGSADTDDAGTNRSYLKGNIYGQVTSAGDPSAAPTNAPTIDDGTTGSVTPASDTAWLVNFQSLAADLDYITFRAMPAATTADTIMIQLRLFVGPGTTPGTLTPLVTLKYQWV